MVDFLFNDHDCDIECKNCEKKILCNIVYIVPYDNDDNNSWFVCGACMMLMIEGDSLQEYAPEWDSEFGRELIKIGNNLQLLIDSVKDTVNDLGVNKNE